MRKFLLLAGVFSAISTQTANAEQVYNLDESYRNSNVEYISYSPNHRVQYPKRQYTTVSDYFHGYKAKPYMGIDISSNQLDFADNELVRFGSQEFFKDKNKAVSFVFGAKFAPMFGAEIFFQQSDESDKYYDHDIIGYEKDSLSFISYGADFQIYVPLKEKLDMLFSLGVANYEFKAKAKLALKDVYGSFSIKEDFESVAWRYGVGVEYTLNDYLRIRGLVRFIDMDDEYIKNMTELSFGLRYLF